MGGEPLFVLSKTAPSLLIHKDFIDLSEIRTNGYFRPFFSTSSTAFSASSTTSFASPVGRRTT